MAIPVSAHLALQEIALLVASGVDRISEVERVVAEAGYLQPAVDQLAAEEEDWDE